MLPKAGDVLRVTKAASVQFVEPMLFRVIRVHDWPTYDGWAWLDGYQLNAAGDAVSRRSIFVQLAGLKPGRESEDETILLWHRGLSLSDIALGHALLSKARSAGIGQRLRFA